MAKTAVVTDSCASLPRRMIDELRITIVPYFVTAEGRMMRDLIDVGSEFLEYLGETKVLTTTANPGPGEYLEAFLKAADGADGLVRVHMTSLGSGAFEAACIARDMFRERFPTMPIEVFDSRNVSMGHGWMALEAARAAARGSGVEQILTLLQRMMPVTRIIQTAESLDYLFKGGRIGRASHMVGTLLKVKPIITMEDGIIAPLAQVRAREMGKVYQKMVDIVRERWGNRALKAAIVHTAAPAAAERLREMVAAQLNCVELFITEMSPTLGVHVGPNSLSLCYVPEEALRTSQ